MGRDRGTNLADSVIRRKWKLFVVFARSAADATGMLAQSSGGDFAGPSRIPRAADVCGSNSRLTFLLTTGFQAGGEQTFFFKGNELLQRIERWVPRGAKHSQSVRSIDVEFDGSLTRFVLQGGIVAFQVRSIQDKGTQTEVALDHDHIA